MEFLADARLATYSRCHEMWIEKGIRPRLATLACTFPCGAAGNRTRRSTWANAF
jgi:hypothetical protein